MKNTSIDRISRSFVKCAYENIEKETQINRKI
jgi:hypothetical protein